MENYRKERKLIATSADGYKNKQDAVKMIEAVVAITSAAYDEV